MGEGNKTHTKHDITDEKNICVGIFWNDVGVPGWKHRDDCIAEGQTNFVKKGVISIALPSSA